MCICVFVFNYHAVDMQGGLCEGLRLVFTAVKTLKSELFQLHSKKKSLLHIHRCSFCPYAVINTLICSYSQKNEHFHLRYVCLQFLPVWLWKLLHFTGLALYSHNSMFFLCRMYYMYIQNVCVHLSCCVCVCSFVKTNEGISICKLCLRQKPFQSAFFIFLLKWLWLWQFLLLIIKMKLPIHLL